MNAVPMLQSCARHQLRPDVWMWQHLKARYEEREFPGPNLLIRTYAIEPDEEGGTIQPIICLKEG